MSPNAQDWPFIPRLSEGFEMGVNNKFKISSAQFAPLLELSLTLSFKGFLCMEEGVLISTDPEGFMRCPIAILSDDVWLDWM